MIDDNQARHFDPQALRKSLIDTKTDGLVK